MKNELNNKIIAIVGTTASGKTKLAVALARKFNGEIISADSRQVYRGLDVGTGKDLDEYKVKANGKIIEVPYHLIDIVAPKKKFDLAKYQKLALKKINDIFSRGKLPIIVGGTGLYVQALVDGVILPPSKPNFKLRKELSKYNISALFKKLLKLNKKFAKNLNNSDKNNKRRLIRYIEIASGNSNKKASRLTARNNSVFFQKALVIGVTWPKEILHKKIYKRLLHRLKVEDMIGEVKRLHKQGVSWKRLESFGLEYKYISWYLQGKIGYQEMVEKLFIAIKKFAKRQMTWWRRWERQGRKIIWLNSFQQAEKAVKEFIK